MGEDKKKTAEEKAAEAQAKAEDKILDEKDELFCGYSTFQIVDQDGYAKVTKGSAIAGPIFANRKDGKVVISSTFASNPLQYLQIQRDTNLFVTGNLLYGSIKKDHQNQIGKMIPSNCDKLCTLMEKTSDPNFTVKVELPFLQGSHDRLADMKITTKEEKFVTKVTGVALELTEQDWMEWKKYRMQFWRMGKAMSGPVAGGGDDDDKDKDKDKDKE